VSTAQVHIALFLDGPLQSWGYQSRFDRRTTLSYPTKSGILGMICAAMGIERDDVDALPELGRLKMKVFLFPGHTRMTDFHTVGGGFDKKTHKQHKVKTADGKTRDTVITRREYLEGAKFGVVISGNHIQLEKISGFLKNPIWGIWLGRKCCTPASPVFQGLFTHEQDALDLLENRAGQKVARVISEVDNFEDGTDSLMDIPLDFGKRLFTIRRIQDEPSVP